MNTQAKPQTVKVVCLWVYGEFYGAFGSMNGAWLKIQDLAGRIPRHAYPLASSTQERTVSHAELEQLVDGEVSPEIWTALVKGRFDHIIKGE